MNFSKIIKTKTFKIQSPNYSKIKLQLKPAEIDFILFNTKEDERGFTYCFTMDSNEKFIVSLLKLENLTSENIFDIIAFLSVFYRLSEPAIKY